MKMYLQESLKVKTNTFDMLTLLKESYSKVSAKSIRNCWRDSQLLHPRQLHVLLELDENEVASDTSDDPVVSLSLITMAFSNFTEINVSQLFDIETRIRIELDDLEVSTSSIAVGALTGDSTAQVEIDLLSGIYYHTSC